MKLKYLFFVKLKKFFSVISQNSKILWPRIFKKNLMISSIEFVECEI